MFQILINKHETEIPIVLEINPLIRWRHRIEGIVEGSLFWWSGTMPLVSQAGKVSKREKEGSMRRVWKQGFPWTQFLGLVDFENE